MAHDSASGRSASGASALPPRVVGSPGPPTKSSPGPGGAPPRAPASSPSTRASGAAPPVEPTVEVVGAVDRVDHPGGSAGAGHVGALLPHDGSSGRSRRRVSTTCASAALSAAVTMSETCVLVSASQAAAQHRVGQRPGLPTRSRRASATSGEQLPGVVHGARDGRGGVLWPDGAIQASDQGAPMSDKSPRQGMSKKSGKSIKEKRAEKHAKAAGTSTAVESLARQEEVSLLSLGVIGTSAKENEHRLPLHPDHLARLDADDRRPHHARARVRRALRPSRRRAGRARGRLRVARGDPRRLRRRGAAQAPARGRGRHARRAGPVGLAALRAGPRADPAGDRPGADPDRLRGDEPLDRATAPSGCTSSTRTTSSPATARCCRRWSWSASPATTAAGSARW